MAEMHRVADAGAPALRRALLFSVARAIRQTKFPRLAEAMAVGSPSGVVNAIEWGAMAETLEEGIVPALTEIHAASAPVQKWERIRNPRAAMAARRQSYDLIQGVTEESKRAIRDLTERLFSGQSTVRATGRLIRDHIGLTRGQSRSLWNYQMELQQQFTANEISAKQLVDRVSRYRDELIAARAEVIARTESMKAANQGQLDSWMQAQSEGLIPEDAQREWVVTDDERLCPLCSPVPARGPVGLYDPFTLGDGTHLMAPPAHPSCRCTVSLVV